MLGRAPSALLLLLTMLLLAMLTACGSAESMVTSAPQVASSEPTTKLMPQPEPTLKPIQPATLTVPLPATATATTTPTTTPTPKPTLPPPTNSPTPSPTPTFTHTPEDTPTFELPTATARPPTATAPPPTATATSALPTPTREAQQPTSTPVPEDGYQFDITMQRMLSIDENGGEIGNHNIYVHAFDAKGNPLNGVVVCRVYALQLQPPDPHACRITGETGPGRLHFDVYAGDIVYVASVDPEHRPLSPHSRPLEQEPENMPDLQELVDNGYCDSVEDCQRRIPINNLVRFHYSYEVHFRRR